MHSYNHDMRTLAVLTVTFDSAMAITAYEVVGSFVQLPVRIVAGTLESDQSLLVNTVAGTATPGEGGGGRYYIHYT